MKYIKIIVFTMIVMILALFAFNNPDKVSLVLGYKIDISRWIIGKEIVVDLPLFLILFVEAFVLVILMSLVGVFENFALRQRIRDLTKETKKQKSELNVIREHEKKPEKPIESKTQREIKAPDVESPQEKKLLEVNKKEAKKKDSKKKESKKKKPGLLNKIKVDKASKSKETDEDADS